MAEERAEHNAKMKKMEAEMEQVFEMKVKEKKQKLKDSEADVSRIRKKLFTKINLGLIRKNKCESRTFPDEDITKQMKMVRY